MAHKLASSNCEGPMTITDDWDLDVALQQSKHTLKLVIRTYQYTDSPGQWVDSHMYYSVEYYHMWDSAWLGVIPVTVGQWRYQWV